MLGVLRRDRLGGNGTGSALEPSPGRIMSHMDYMSKAALPGSTALSRIAKWTLIVLAIALASWVAYFPSPYGLETRPISSTSLIFGIPFFVGLVLNIAAIPVLWRRPRTGSLLAVLLGIAFIIGILFDQAGLVVPGQTPPLIVTAFQVEGVVLSILLIALGYTSFRATTYVHP